MNAGVMVSVMAVSVCAWMQGAETAEQKKAVHVVKEAIAFGTAHGKEKLLKEVNMANGKFHVSSESTLYVSIYDLNGLVLGHGYTPNKVGTNRFQTKDVDGKFYIQEFIKIAKDKGNGWVSYKHEDPATKKLGNKQTYVELWGDCIVSCGAHK